MSWSEYDTHNYVPQEVVHAFFDLLDRINYAYLKIDGTYGDLHPVVRDKVNYAPPKGGELAVATV